MAREIVDRFRGRTPRTRAQLESLSGVGQYKANALKCFAYGEPEALLDTNTVRVLSRLRGLKKTDASRRSRMYHEEMARLVDPSRPREFNFALLDLAALVCRPSHPRCGECPVLAFCVFGSRRVRQTRNRGARHSAAVTSTSRDARLVEVFDDSTGSCRVTELRNVLARPTGVRFHSYERLSDGTFGWLGQFDILLPDA